MFLCSQSTLVFAFSGIVQTKPSEVGMHSSSFSTGSSSSLLTNCFTSGLFGGSTSVLSRPNLPKTITDPNSLDPADFRRTIPLFQSKNLGHNLEFVNFLKELASANDVTPAQIALSWLLRQGNDIVPIPGTRHLQFLEENAAAATLVLPEEAWSTLDKMLMSFRALGARYAQHNLRVIDT